MTELWIVWGWQSLVAAYLAVGFLWAMYLYWWHEAHIPSYPLNSEDGLVLAISAVGWPGSMVAWFLTWRRSC